MAASEMLSGFVGTGSGTDAVAGMLTSQRAGRRDGRTAGAMREVSATQGGSLRADGSARVRIGLTDVSVSVYGPMECAVHRQVADRAEVHVSFRQRVTSTTMSVSSTSSGVRKSVPGEAVAGRDLREIVMQSVLVELHPRKAIAIAVHVLADDGGAAAAAINATYLALMDAGVNMRSVRTACCVSLHNGAVVVDPDGAEESEADAVLTATFDPSQGGSPAALAAVHCRGDMGDFAAFEAAMTTARELSEKTRAFVRLAVQGKVSSSLHI